MVSGVGELGLVAVRGGRSPCVLAGWLVTRTNCCSKKAHALFFTPHPTSHPFLPPHTKQTNTHTHLHQRTSWARTACWLSKTPRATPTYARSFSPPSALTQSKPTCQQSRRSWRDTCQIGRRLGLRASRRTPASRCSHLTSSCRCVWGGVCLGVWGWPCAVMLCGSPKRAGRWPTTRCAENFTQGGRWHCTTEHYRCPCFPT